MPISGPEMHRSLIDGFKRLQNRLESTRQQSVESDDNHGELKDDRSEALLDLARHYLPELSATSIEATWPEVRSSLNSVLMRMQDKRRRCRLESQAVNDRRSIEEDRLIQLNADLDTATEKRDALATDIQRQLAEDETFVELSQRAAAAETALERAEANLNEIEQDAARKLPGFKKSTLFSYLIEQNYGTDRYGSRGFTRRMDRWLAKYIDFSKAKKSYDFLTQTPDQMRSIIANDRAALQTVMEEIEQRHDHVVKKSGLPKTIETVHSLTAERETLLKSLEKTRERSESLEDQLDDLENPQGEFYREAIEVFRRRLAAIKTTDLDSKAKSTVEVTDDQIVARIQGIDASLERLDEEQRRSRKTVRDLQRGLDALGRMMQKFRAAKFDAARSQFLDSFNVGDRIDRVNEADDIDDLWQDLRRAQRWGPSAAQQVGGNPVTSLLVGAMAEAAGAMTEQARRAAHRSRRSYSSRRRN
ncbi:coiled-coil domain-containing protein [Roseiconus lacunae]|uniref:hypothetical protein n=1 Tax=Roseiconus lacunae TaxID=2605694 RepID=UPI0011F3AC04|nr:hypothetical protein [Roseiconus lacunae]